MKSGPTLNGATRCPARRTAPIRPVATVVLPLPEEGAATTTAGTLTPTHSPFDAALTLAAGIHRVLDLGHLSDEVRGVDQRGGSIAARDDDVLIAGTRRQHVDDVTDVDPAPLERVGELVEHVEVATLLGDSPGYLGPSVGGRRGMVYVVT